MKYRTVVESDGQAVYITAQQSISPGARVLHLAIGVLVLAAFLALPFSGLFPWVKMLSLWLLMAASFVYPVLSWVLRMFVCEEIRLDTCSIRVERRLGRLRAPGIRKNFPDVQLATGSEKVSPKSDLLRVSWFAEAGKDQKPVLLYRHFFPMTTAQYQQTTEYMQELFDLEGSDQFELLFSAN